MQFQGKLRRLSAALARRIPLMLSCIAVQVSAATPLPDVIVIGSSIPLSGGVAIYGTGQQYALDLAAAEINAAGGIRGRKISIIYEDNKGTGQDGTVAFRKLVAKGIPVVQMIMTAPENASIPIAKETKTLLFDTGSVDMRLAETGGEWYVSIAPKSVQEAQAHIDLAYDKLGARNAAIYYRNDSTNTPYYAVLKDAWEKKGGKLVFDASHQPDSQTDFRAALLKMKDANPDVIFMPTFIEQGALIVRQAKELGIKAQFISYGALLYDKFVQIAGPASEGVLATGVGIDSNNKDPKVQKFIADWTAKYKAAPDFYPTLTYDALYMLAKAIDNCNCYDSVGIRDALVKLKEFPAISGPITFGNKNVAQLPFRWRTVKDGKIVDYRP